MSGRDARAITVGAALILVSWLFLRGGPRAWAFVAHREEALTQESALLARERAALAEVDDLTEWVAEAESTSATLHRRLLIGGDAATATFDLYRRLIARLPDSLVSLQSAEPTEDTLRIADLRRAGFRAAMETNLPGLLHVLRAVENDSVLAVDQLYIETQNPDAASADEERLLARIHVVGWFLAPERDSVAASGAGG